MNRIRITIVNEIINLTSLRHCEYSEAISEDCFARSEPIQKIAELVPNFRDCVIIPPGHCERLKEARQSHVFQHVTRLLRSFYSFAMTSFRLIQ